ncbi:hypothetical protein [Gluconobacter oxydans]|uniref:terminase small subunit-like protein n=1 Tax=Gluconobacter oxydans TaxID=442 RepID=UPI0038CFD153
MAPRHRLYTPEIAEEILERLSDGESLASICEREGMPSRGAVNHWVITDHDGFASRYACAREAGLMVMADDIDVPPFLYPLKRRVPVFYGFGLMG